MTTMYQRGTYFERLTVNWLKREGLLVTRSAASKGIIDIAVFPLVTISPILKLKSDWNNLPFDIDKPFVIQVKSTRTINGLLERGCNSLGLFRTIVDKNVYKLQDANIPFTNKYVLVYNDFNKRNLPFIYKYIESTDHVKWELIDSYQPNPNDKVSDVQQLREELYQR